MKNVTATIILILSLIGCQQAVEPNVDNNDCPQLEAEYQLLDADEELSQKELDSCFAANTAVQEELTKAVSEKESCFSELLCLKKKESETVSLAQYNGLLEEFRKLQKIHGELALEYCKFSDDCSFYKEHLNEEVE